MRIEIVDEMHARGPAQIADARHLVIGELRQRLPAERGAAGAEYDDIARARGERLGSAANLGEIVLLFRQVQQRQRALGIQPAQLIERAFRAGQGGRKRGLGDAVLANVLFQRAVDRLDEGHGGTFRAVIVRASGRFRSSH